MFEGWDASGKGGAIKRLVANLDPRHVRVTEFAAPTPDEKRHHFLWRFWPALPGWGGMAILDRSWYGRVLVERVEGFASASSGCAPTTRSTHFERSLTDEGTILIKFWMHISDAEQLRALREAREEPAQGLEAHRGGLAQPRPCGDQYTEAVEDMIARTDQPYAPWDLVAADSKRYARVKVIETVIERIENGMRRWDFEPPEPGQRDRA